MKKGISPVVATTLLIAIAVIASTTTWYWVASYTVKPALAETGFQSYTVPKVYKISTSSYCNAIDIKNTGGKTLRNVILYIKDYNSGKPAGQNGTNPTYPGYLNLTSLEPGVTQRFPIYSLGNLEAFQETNISDLPTIVNTIAVGDSNNDGKNEIVIGLDNMSGSYEVRLYENSTTAWQETNIADITGVVRTLAVGDANNDSQNEIVVGLYDSNPGVIPYELRMYKNTTGKWVETNISDLPASVYRVAIGDANNDGSQDIVIGLGGATNELRMYENKTGKWVETNISDLPGSILALVIGDVTNDGKNDIAIGLSASLNETRVYENKTGKWVETNISDVQPSIYTVAIGDANNDGANELLNGVVSDGSFPYELRMYKNTSGTWVETNVSDLDNTVVEIKVADVKNTGKNYVVMTMNSAYNETRVYENTSGRWVETNVTNLPAFGSCLATGDPNNDNLKEILVGMATTAYELRMYTYTNPAISIPLGTYILRTSDLGFSDQLFTCA